MSVLLSRHAVLEAVQVQSWAPSDDQGKPTYAASVTIQGRVVFEDSVVIGKGGETEKTRATIWINSDQVPLPNADDRITLASGFVGIVIERKEGKTSQSGLDHVRVRLREE